MGKKKTSGEISVNRAYREIPRTSADIARQNSFETLWTACIGQFTKRTRELAEMPDANQKLIAYNLRCFLKEFEPSSLPQDLEALRKREDEVMAELNGMLNNGFSGHLKLD